MKNSFFTIILIVTLFASCTQKKSITLSTSIAGSTWHNNGVLIADAMNSFGWEIEVLHGAEFATKGRSFVRDNTVDFAIVPNNRIIDQGILRAVAPLNQEALLILYKDDGRSYNTFKELINGKNILFPISNTNAPSLISEILSTLEIEQSSYKEYHMNLEKLDLTNDSWKSELDSIDVMLSFTQLNSPIAKEILNQGWKILKIADIKTMNQGSLIDAFCLKYPWAFPIVIPVNVFGQQQPEPIYTIGLRSLLIANKDLDEELVYDFLRDFYASLPAMSQNDVSFALIQENYNKSTISYPLHDGTIRYIDRDQPMFIERYAELIALIVTLIVLFVGIANRYIKFANQKKKDRIDVYYDMILASKSVEELEKVRLKAIHQMQEENLLADETFVIFLQLYEQRKDEL